MKKIILNGVLIAITLFSGVVSAKTIDTVGLKNYSVACLAPGIYDISYTKTLVEAKQKAKSCENAGGIAVITAHYTV